MSDFSSINSCGSIQAANLCYKKTKTKKQQEYCKSTRRSSLLVITKNRNGSYFTYDFRPRDFDAHLRIYSVNVFSLEFMNTQQIKCFTSSKCYSHLDLPIQHFYAIYQNLHKNASVEPSESQTQ